MTISPHAAATTTTSTAGTDSVVEPVSMPSPDAARRTKGHRRPSGAPPPLPRSLGRTGKVWLVGAALLISWIIIATFSAWARRVTDRADAAVLRQFVHIRTPWLTHIMSAVARAGSGW